MSRCSVSSYRQVRLGLAPCRGYDAIRFLIVGISDSVREGLLTQQTLAAPIPGPPRTLRAGAVRNRLQAMRRVLERATVSQACGGAGDATPGAETATMTPRASGVGARSARRGRQHGAGEVSSMTERRASVRQPQRRSGRRHRAFPLPLTAARRWRHRPTSELPHGALVACQDALRSIERRKTRC